MTFSRTLLGAKIIALIVFTVTFSYANDAQDQSQIRISGTVDSVCSFNTNGTTTLNNGVFDFSPVSEMCNSPDGYVLSASIPSELEGATLRIGPNEIILSNDPIQTLFSSNVPTYNTITTLTITPNVDDDDIAPTVNITFTISPKGEGQI